MANSFKTFLPEDIANTRTLLHEAIPLTGTIVSGTYGENNIKEYSHGMFQSVYDYPFLSSSANHIFDITWGYATGSSLENAANAQNTKKVNIYNQMALVLNNLDISGNIKNFDKNGSEDTDTTDDMRECVFISFARLLNKDEIKKDSFRFTCFTGSAAEGLQTKNQVVIGDYNAQTNYKTNSPSGEYGLLYTSSAGITDASPVGHIYYQAGIAVLTGAIWPHYFGAQDNTSTMTGSMSKMLQSGTINQLSDGLRFFWKDLDFNNTTELNSTIYFARAHNTEFNYSSNTTYLSSSQIVVKGNNPSADPVAYITSVGLYSPDNELLAVAKLSEPLKKSPSNEITLRVRLDF
tara:strand:- start:1191 stop:2237 length:1047 start_codon:yes stop_codon:yes gene_type:complete